MQKMSLNGFGSAAGGLFVVGLIVYAFTGDVIDLGWLFLSLMIGLAAAAVLGQAAYTATRSNDAAANYVVAGTLMICGVVSLVSQPDLDDNDAYYEFNPNRADGSAPLPAQPGFVDNAPQASSQALVDAQTAFVGDELQLTMNLNRKLDRVYDASQQVYANSTAEEINKLLLDFDRQSAPLTDAFEDAIESQSERLRQHLLKAGASRQQANELTNAYARSSAATMDKDRRMHEVWCTIFNLNKQWLVWLRDHRDDWTVDEEGVFAIDNASVLHEYEAILDKIEAASKKLEAIELE